MNSEASVTELPEEFHNELDSLDNLPDYQLFSLQNNWKIEDLQKEAILAGTNKLLQVLQQDTHLILLSLKDWVKSLRKRFGKSL